MDTDFLVRLIYLIIVYSLGSLALFFIIFIFTSPSQYNPYNPDLIEEDADSSQTETNAADEGYGYHGKGRNTNKTLRVETSVQVVVLGDIGRSPRMQYHALSLAKHGARVDLIGFQESDIHPELVSKKSVTVVPLAPPPFFLRTSNKVAFIVVGPLKAIWQALNLYYVLAHKTKPSKWMLVQNPPSIPVLAVARLVCAFRNTSLIIDWHNYGWSVLSLKLGPSHPLVFLSKIYENLLSWSADAHFTVTDAMATSLSKSIRNAPVLTLHDRPTPIFKPLTRFQRDAVLARLSETSTYAPSLSNASTRLLVSSTSWTPDEDFSLFLSAMVAYSERATTTDKSLPYILAVITGKGPQKERYLRDIRALTQANKLSHVTITTAWLNLPDYASLLGAADLGISLHKSTSGVDLPMKVVDMFGAGLPVAGYSAYESWPELVKEGVNGRGFETGEELGELLVELFGTEGRALGALREGAVREGGRRWDDEWDEVAGKKVFRFAQLLGPVGGAGAASKK